MYNSFTHGVDNCISLVKRTYGALCDMCYPPTYLFFPGNEVPYQYRLVNVDAAGSAKPEWSYVPETNQFVEWPFLDAADTKLSDPLPILSMEIIDAEERVLYDLTDFIEKVKVYTDKFYGASPCIAHIIGAWALSSGVVLDHVLDLKVRFINTSADTRLLSIYDTDSEYVTQEIQGLVEEEKSDETVDEAVADAVEESTNTTKDD